MRYQDFSKLFFGLLILHLAVIFKPESMALYYISKPALLFSLLSFFLHRAAGWPLNKKLIFFLALFFSLAGDVVLMLDGEPFFLIGMASFALAHLAYIGFYISLRLPAKMKVIIPAMLFPLSGILAMVFFVDTPVSLERFLYIYAVIIGIHFVMSTRFIKDGISTSFWPVIGAALFIISDFLLAFQLFNYESKFLKMSVMLTYALAQYLIVIGVLRTAKSETGLWSKS